MLSVGHQYVGDTRDSGIVSSADDVLGMNMVGGVVVSRTRAWKSVVVLCLCEL